MYLNERDPKSGFTRNRTQPVKWMYQFVQTSLFHCQTYPPPLRRSRKQFRQQVRATLDRTVSGQISSRPHTTDLPPKGSLLEGKSPYFREIQVGEILFHLARYSCNMSIK